MTGLRRALVFAALVGGFSLLISHYRHEPEPTTLRVVEGTDCPVHGEVATAAHVAAHAGRVLPERPSRRRAAPGDVEALAEDTIGFADDIAEALGAEAGLRWTECEEDRCAAFIQILGIADADVDVARRVMGRDGLPFSVAWWGGDRAETFLAFGDQQLSHREAVVDSDTRMLNGMTNAGLSYEEAVRRLSGFGRDRSPSPGAGGNGRGRPSSEGIQPDRVDSEDQPHLPVE